MRKEIPEIFLSFFSLEVFHSEDDVIYSKNIYRKFSKDRNMALTVQEIIEIKLVDTKFSLLFLFYLPNTL